VILRELRYVPRPRASAGEWPIRIIRWVRII
jgi:hypothetical protein